MESQQYQQLMYDMLGNRDYDNFESDELDSLKRKIGYALYGHPQSEDGYDTEQNNLIEKLYDTILKESDKYSKHKNRVVISFVYNCTEPTEKEKKKRAAKYEDYNPKTDVQPHPVFVLRKCKFSPTSCRIVIDHSARVYQSWEEYLCRNTLPKCLMVFPRNGRYTGDENGKVILESRASPSCGVRARVLARTDVASTGLGIASAGVVIAASIPTVTIVGPIALCGAGIAGIGVGIYSMGRSLGTLYDKNRHKESLSFSNSVARSAYINIIAGAMGFFGAGANVAVSQLASRGVNIGREVSLLMNITNVANISTSGLSIINSGYEVLEPWMTKKKSPSLLALVQLSSSVLFFGHAVYNFKSASNIVEETQTRILENIQRSLKDNKHRKAFEKYRLQTIRRNDGKIQKGNAEVIATMRKIMDENQLLEILLKNDNDFKELGVAQKGDSMTCNGVPVILGEINNISKGKLDNFFSSKGSDTTTPVNIGEIKDNLKNTFIELKLNEGSVSRLSNYFVGLATFANGVAGPILSFIKEFIYQYLIKDENMLKTINELFPNSEEKCLQIINCIAGFIYEEARKLDTKTSEQKQNEENSLKDHMKTVCDSYSDGGKLSEYAFNEIKRYFANLMIEHALLYKERKKRKEMRLKLARNVERVKCPNCFGLHYVVL
ncbi:hypothetical protein HHI36_012026 [Cryptolaemus montrouzieri]|uniref:DUF4781 domain-containing protein n=1 Tax=Cryptolaemus montrouzieri TaxID=559131 RepID=A0ABD2NEL2_9CUCU